MTLRVLSLGAGVQSTTLLLMAYEGEIERPDCAVFADTGWEPAGVYRHLAWLEALVSDRIPVHRVSAGNIRNDVLSAHRDGMPPFYVTNSDGSGGSLRRQCTGDYKLDPIRRKVRGLLGPGRPRAGAVEMWLGISLDEVQRMKPSRVHYITNRWPLIDRRMTRSDCLVWLDGRGYPRPPKSACIGCPYRDNRQWRDMRDNRPEEWADAVAFDLSLRSPQLQRLLHGSVYVHRSRIPLAQVDLTTEQDRGQLDMWGDECEGMCGV